MPSFSFSSDLQASPGELCATLTMAGVNAELGPLVRMTAPVPYSQRSILEWPQRRRLFDSWILLFGFLPIDRHSFYFEAIDPSEGFSEASTSWTNAYWRHRRRIVRRGPGSRVTDTVQYKSRMPLLDVLLKPVYQWVFWHRHRYLRARYGGPGS